MKIFTSNKSKKIADKLVLAIGGGSIIDEAKTYAKRHGKFCLAVPTTGSGASETSHAVKWGKKKVNIPTDKPISISPPVKITLDKKTRQNTMADILGHIIDYLNVCSDNELIGVGRYAGQLIEKHPTNLTHPLSYKLTLLYDIPHGEAVKLSLIPALKKMLDL